MTNVQNRLLTVHTVSLLEIVTDVQNTDPNSPGPKLLFVCENVGLLAVIASHKKFLHNDLNVLKVAVYIHIGTNSTSDYSADLVSSCKNFSDARSDLQYLGCHFCQ